MKHIVRKQFWKITSNGPPNRSRFKHQKLTESEQQLLCAYLVPFVNRALIPSWCVTGGWLGPWLCKDECRAEALMITTNNTTKWSWKEHETTTNRTKNSVLDFLMLITCDPPLWSTRKRCVQSFPDLALEVSLKYQGCSATLNTRRIKGYSVAFDEVASNFREEENRKLFSEYLSITLINLKYKLLNVHYYMRAYVYIEFCL